MLMNSTRKEEPLEPSELWLALTALPRPHKLVPMPRYMPGTDTSVGDVAIWPLTQEEQMLVNAAADKFTKELLKDPQQKDQANLGYHHTYANEVAVQVLCRACRRPDDLDKPAFPSAKLLRATLTTDEVGVLFNHYATVQSELGPIRAHMTAEETEGLILRLHDGGSAFPFSTLSWELQRTLVSSLASRLYALWKAQFSAGLPLDVTTFVLERLRDEQSSSEGSTTTESSPDADAETPDDYDPDPAIATDIDESEP